jgi:hypothetical protein
LRAPRGTASAPVILSLHPLSRSDLACFALFLPALAYNRNCFSRKLKSRGSAARPVCTTDIGSRRPIMRNLIKTAALLALLGSRIAMAQTVGKSPAAPTAPIVTSSLAQDTRPVGGAPIGHRQPQASDVPSEAAANLEQLSAEDAAVDRKLNICRGC